jgi:hypothetical protein
LKDDEIPKIYFKVIGYNITHKKKDEDKEKEIEANPLYPPVKIMSLAEFLYRVRIKSVKGFYNTLDEIVSASTACYYDIKMR